MNQAVRHERQETCPQSGRLELYNINYRVLAVFEEDRLTGMASNFACSIAGSWFRRRAMLGPVNAAGQLQIWVASVRLARDGFAVS